MDYDLKITGGTLVDGTGAPARRADVAVRDGRIVAVGECPGAAARTLDADGAIVTPGFVDIHCHYDGQVSWDETLSPSASHGVTTCVIGNCGVGFAPVHERDRARLIALMEGVEDIPGSALAEGMQWSWETFPEFLDTLAAKPRSIDVLAQVPHDALRVFVMGDRAVAHGVATADDIARMRDLVREALLAGAAGFSTGRSDNHVSVTGEATPASESGAAELAGIAAAFEGLSHGVLQAVSDFDMPKGPDRFDAEFDVIERMAEGASGHAVSISLMQRDMEPDQWRRILARVEAADARGVPMRVQVAPRAIGVLLGLEATFHPFMGFPSYKAIAHLPLAERVAAMRDPAFKARLLTEQSEKVAGDGSKIPPLADLLLARIEMVALRLFRLGVRPSYEPTVEQSLYAEAQATGRPPLDVVYDALLDHDGRELLYFPLYNYTEFSLDNVRAMLGHPLSLVGLSDGGAHVGTVCDASYATFALMHWARDRADGRIPLEALVKKLAHDTARFIGLRDRGTVAVGQRADLNVIDLANLALHRPRMTADLPAGGKRLVQDATGYRATLVAGQVIVDHDRMTDARPGALVRMGRAEA
jgi:N-acyl-D-aspartate/D-glutamate deacylase